MNLYEMNFVKVVGIVLGVYLIAFLVGLGVLIILEQYFVLSGWFGVFIGCISGVLATVCIQKLVG